ncbi:bifunctional lysylphosphatidylglycerol flippase/synthetase MprF [Chachezhania antarctica]|uniref:bifunctional lysylphosphatidylglycerol flippase/synthetase MprF n=1 Tax=Chachezhania antarctica TaxID=2340860 RepID=UPI000EB57D21|nr:bifunctional lysylphosphatidylglycerol flippase/synthetase MprF [Chachezhania antarctica]
MTKTDIISTDKADTPRAFLVILKRHAPLIVTCLLFIAGAYALYHLLAPLDMRVVMQQVLATPPHLVAGALAATVASYAALICYDWSALRYIGRTAPPSSVVLGGFLGYALGNTIGLSAVSGGAVRYRIYSALGLDAFEVAAISTFAATAFGVGSTLIGLVALVLLPGALSDLLPWPPETVRWGSIALCAVMAAIGAAIALRGGALKLGRFRLTAPSGGDMIRQLVITFVDIVMAAMALYLLLPAGSLPFTELLAVFAIATLAGVASHVPGGIGVFESIVIAAIPATVPVEDVVTGLLLYRLIYFLLPFMVALLLLSLTEVWSAAGARLPQIPSLMPVVRAGRSMIPAATGALALAAGLFMMFAGFLPHPAAAELETILPLSLLAGGPMVSSILGTLLAVLAVPLLHRSQLALWIVLGALVLGTFLAMTRTEDTARVLLLAGMALLLWPCRREFYRTARLSRNVLSSRWWFAALSMLAAFGVTAVLLHVGAVPPDAMWWQMAGGSPADSAWRTTLAGSVILGAVLLYVGLRVARATTEAPDTAALARAAAIIGEHGDGADMIILTGDKTLMFGPGGQSVLAYGVKGKSWIAMGAPVGVAEDVADLAWDFRDAARAAGSRPVFYEAPAAFAPQAIDMGLKLHKMGEEAVVPLARFSLDGPDRKRLRTTFNRARRDGLTFEILDAPCADLIEALRPLSDTWLADQSAREKCFSVGRFDPAWLARTRIAVVRLNGEVCAFANIMDTGRSAAIDLMRHGAQVPAGTMEYLFVELLLAMKAEGKTRFSLGMVPFAGLSGRKGATLWARFGNLIYVRGQRFYSFEGLRRFKAKFDPEWHPRYFCCRTSLPPVGPLSEAARLISGSARGIIGK